MTNLLQNPTWKSDDNGLPMYYAATGPITYDNFVIDGFRTCSITMPNGQTAMGGYVPFIEVAGKKTIQIGMEMRAIDLTSIMFAVSFFNTDGVFMDSANREVSYLVSDEFDDVFESFSIPEGADYARVDCIFYNKITACTFYNPRVYTE